MLDFLVNILRAAPLITALFIVAGMNTRRPHRVQQTWIPVVAIAFALVALVLLYRFNDGIDQALAGLMGTLPWTLPQFSTANLYLLENVLVLLIFAVVKFILRPVFKRFFSGGRSIAQFAAARIYEYDPEFELWFVEYRHKRLRDFYRVLYWASMALAVLLIASAITFQAWPGFSAIAFPALAVMLIGEFYFAIDGVTKEEYSHSLFGERDVARRVGNFGPLRGVLSDTFPERVLGEGVQLSSIASLDSGFRVGEMTRSSDPNVRLAGAYFERLRQDGVDIDVNLVGSASDLMAGRSVLYANPFYADLTPYLSLPVYRELLEGRRCLIVSGRDSLSDDLADWIERGLEQISGVPHLWQVRQLDAVSKEIIDVGVLRSADLHNLDVLGNSDDFFRDVGLIILAEPSMLLATGQLGLELVHQRCSRESPTTLAAFDGNHDGLVDTLSHLTKTNITEVVASPLPQGASSELIWQGDGPHMHTSILPGVTRYLGVGTEIGAVALKYQVQRVHWIGGQTFPVVDMRWIAQQYYASINQFADLELSQDSLADSLIAVPNPWALPQSENYFLIVEDETNNAYESVRLFATRAKHSGFVNLVSDEYLLRDYMVANREVFAVDPKAIPSIVPDYARTERNVTLRLLLALKVFGVALSELQKQLDLPSWSLRSEPADHSTDESAAIEPRPVSELRQAIKKHVGIDQAPIALAGPALVDSPPDEDEDPRYVLLPGSDLDPVLAALGPAYFFVEDDLDGNNVIGSILLDHVYQSLLPGQFVTYGGKFYEVQGISHDQKHSRVILRRAADHIRERTSYRQLRGYRLSELREADQLTATKSRGDIEVSRIILDVEVETFGYLEGPTRSDLAQAQRVTITGVPPRRYANKAALKITLPDAPPDVRKTLAVLLNEVFVTTFPYSYQYVCALTSDAEEEFGDLLPRLFVPPAEQDQMPDDSIFIVEDSLIDLGLTSAVERNWERLFEIIADYLSWHEAPEPPEEGTRAPIDGIRLFPDRPPQSAEGEDSWLTRVKTVVARLRPAKERHSHATRGANAAGELFGTSIVSTDVEEAEEKNEEQAQPHHVDDPLEEQSEDLSVFELDPENDPASDTSHAVTDEKSAEESKPDVPSGLEPEEDTLMTGAAVPPREPVEHEPSDGGAHESEEAPDEPS